jgi:anti-anti-sigma regulatory factor
MVESFTTGQLEITVERDGAETRAVLVGQLDETAALAEFGARMDGRLVLDLEKVSFVNSVGVREWIRLLRALDRSGVAVRLRRCSEAMVHQMNMIVEAKGAATVESFFAPYVCEGCGHEASMCVDVAANAAALRAQALPPASCPDCRRPMELNEVPARYLLFLD